MQTLINWETCLVRRNKINQNFQELDTRLNVLEENIDNPWFDDVEWLRMTIVWNVFTLSHTSWVVNYTYNGIQYSIPDWVPELVANLPTWSRRQYFWYLDNTSFKFWTTKQPLEVCEVYSDWTNEISTIWTTQRNTSVKSELGSYNAILPARYASWFNLTAIQGWITASVWTWIIAKFDQLKTALATTIWAVYYLEWTDAEWYPAIKRKPLNTFDNSPFITDLDLWIWFTWRLIYNFLNVWVYTVWVLANNEYTCVHLVTADWVLANTTALVWQRKYTTIANAREWALEELNTFYQHPHTKNVKFLYSLILDWLWAIQYVNWLNINTFLDWRKTLY
jgi:hypothetical protein